MSPLWMRIFTLVGMALALASMQMKTRAQPVAAPQWQAPAVVVTHFIR